MGITAPDHDSAGGRAPRSALLQSAGAWIRVRPAYGTLLDTLDTTTGANFTTGMCFDASGKLYVTTFNANTTSVFDSGGNLVAANFGSGYNADDESCTTDQAGHIFVGQADGSRNILEFDSTGNLVNTFAPTTSP